MASNEHRSRIVFISILASLLALSALCLWLESITGIDFFLHLAAIPIEILMGAILLGWYLAQREKEVKKLRFMYFKSYLFRSEMRGVFISNFAALAQPEISLEWIRTASLVDLKRVRSSIKHLEYKSPAAMEEVLSEYINAESVWRTYLEWAADNDFEAIFRDMLYILHFIQDVKVFKENNPGKFFAEEMRSDPRQDVKIEKILREGIEKFLDYAIELHETASEVFEDLLEDYVLTATMRDTLGAAGVESIAGSAQL